MIWRGLIILVMILMLLVPISKLCQILITKKNHSSKKELFFYAKVKLYDYFTIRENGKSATN